MNTKCIYQQISQDYNNSLRTIVMIIPRNAPAVCARPAMLPYVQARAFCSSNVVSFVINFVNCHKVFVCAHVYVVAFAEVNSEAKHQVRYAAK